LVTDNDVDTVGDQLVRGGHRLLALAIVVDFDEPSGLAKNTARRIQIRDGHLGAALDPFAHPGVRAGVRRRETDQDLGVGERRGAEGRCQGNNESCHQLLQGLGPPGDSRDGR
jgi:hypothetical protein